MAGGLGGLVMTDYLSVSDLKIAIAMWADGADTADIAAHLGVPEAAVANSLGDVRDRKWANQVSKKYGLVKL